MNKQRVSTPVVLVIIFGLLVAAANVCGLFFSAGNSPAEPLTAEQTEMLAQDVSLELARGGREGVSELAAQVLSAVAPEEPMPIESAETTEAIGAVFSQNRAIGASVAVITDGRVSWHYEYGYADRENEVAAVRDTKFRVASLSKVITVMNAMSLVDSGKLTLDSDLSDVFGYRVRNPLCVSTPITVRHLMTHTSSIKDLKPNYAGSLRGQLAESERYGTYTPGGRFSYSNFGIGTLGSAIECASGQKLYDYAASAFFDPMGIDASYEGSLIAEPSLIASCYFRSALDRSAEQMASGFTPEAIGESVHLAAGNLIISAVDYARMTTVLINDGMYNGERYLSEQSVTDMETVYLTASGGFGQCLGLRYKSGLIAGHDMYYHNGNAYGVLSLVCYDPVQRSGVVVITSGSREETVDGIYKVCRDAAQICYEQIIDA